MLMMLIVIATGTVMITPITTIITTMFMMLIVSGVGTVMSQSDEIDHYHTHKF
jgi:hypothetical protein